MTTWIPVTERLPEENQEVLTANEFLPYQSGLWSYEVLEFRDGKFYSSEDLVYCRPLMPSYWQSLPEPPCTYEEVK